MIAVARASHIEQISAIISRAWWGPCQRNDRRMMRCGAAAAGASLLGQAPRAPLSLFLCPRESSQSKPFFEACRRSGLIPMQPHESAPLAFIRARVGPRPRDVRQALLFLEFYTARSTRGGLQIVRECLGRRPAPHGQAADFEFRHDSLQRQAHMIANSNAMRGLYALGIQMNLAAVDGRRREAAGFEEPGMPQPFVQAMIITVLISCHKGLGCRGYTRGEPAKSL